MAAVLKSGWVSKDSEWRKKDNKRFLVVTASALQWFKSEDTSGKPLGNIPLTEGDVMVAAVCLPDEGAPENAFKVVQRGGRTLFLKAENLDDAKAWASTIAKANPPHTSALYSMLDPPPADAPQEVRTVFTVYDAFTKFDHATMGAQYSADLSFEDPVFSLTTGAEVAAMFKMFCTGGNLDKITFRDIGGDGQGRAWGHWEAYYTFSATGRKVHNKMDVMVSKFDGDGKIQEQKDEFNFYAWAKQALGAAGTALGWSNVLHQTVRKQGRERLDEFMQSSEEGSKEMAASIVQDLTGGAVDQPQSGTFTNTFRQRYEHSAAKVWALVGSWSDPSWTGSNVEEVETEGEVKAGVVRTVHLANGNTYVDELVSRDDDAMLYVWKIVKGAMPTKNHTSYISVAPAGDNACYFEWTHTYTLPEDGHQGVGPYMSSSISALSKGSAMALAAKLG